MKKGILFIITMATICFAANAQTYTTLGIGIASPNGTLHVHSSENHFLDPPIEPPIRNDFDQYYTILRLSNTATGVRDTDGFVVTLDNKEVSVSQLENAQFRIENHQSRIILNSNGYMGIGAVGSGVYKFNVNSPMRVNGTVRLENDISMAGGININNSSISLNSNGSAVFANQVQIGNGFLCSATGNLKVKDLRVTLSGWSDFVFDEGYRLMPLGEVVQYVSVHHHLPDVPSATEIEENGLDVGEMNKVLLQKVEELTLYVIDMQKQIDELKSNK